MSSQAEEAESKRFLDRIDFKKMDTTSLGNNYFKICAGLICLVIFIFGFVIGYVSKPTDNAPAPNDNPDLNNLFSVMDSFPTEVWTQLIHKRINVGKNNFTFCTQHCLELNQTGFPGCHFFNHYGYFCYFGDFRTQSRNQLSLKDQEIPPNNLDIYYLKNSYDFKADFLTQHPNLPKNQCLNQGYLEVDSSSWTRSISLKYENNMDCWWLVHKTHDYSGHFELTFPNFKGEEPDYDYLQLQLGPYEKSPKFGKKLNGTLNFVKKQWSSPIMVIHWHTDKYTSLDDMNGEIKFVPE